MGKLTKMKIKPDQKQITEKEKKAMPKFREGLVKFAATLGIGFTLVTGLTGCQDPLEIKYCEDPHCFNYHEEYVGTHTHDYCQDDDCLIGDQYAHGEYHDYCAETDCTEKHPDGKHPVEPEPEPEPEPEIGGGEGGTTEPLTPLQPGFCADEDCYNKGQTMTNHVHDYCDEEGCLLDETVKHTTHDYCNKPGCKLDDSVKHTTHVYCDDGNCVGDKSNSAHQHDYCDEYGCVKNGKDDNTYPHTHDYCKDCDGNQTNKNHTCPEPEINWFTTATFGENINVNYVDIDSVPGANAKEMFNNIFNQYKSHLQDFDINDQLSTVEFDLNNATEFDHLIGSVSGKKEGTCRYNGINDICAPAIEKITQNISNSGNITDKTLFKMYYQAISNEAYRLGYSADITTKKALDGSESKNSFEYTYIKAKADCSKYDGREQIPFEYKYFYLENGELNPEVVTAFDTAIQIAATKMQIDANELYKFINLSLTASTIAGIHDKSISWTYTNEQGQLQNAHHNSYDAGDANCATNEMVDVISNTDLVATTKLNKSIFSQDMGRELC